MARAEREAEEQREANEAMKKRKMDEEWKKHKAKEEAKKSGKTGRGQGTSKAGLKRPARAPRENLDAYESDFVVDDDEMEVENEEDDEEFAHHAFDESRFEEEVSTTNMAACARSIVAFAPC